MAAPAGPRPGWSRRAQYGLFFSFVATVAGLVVGLILFVLSLVAPGSYAAVRGAALDATAPVSGVLREVTTTVTGLAGGAGNYWDAARQNAGLKRDREALMRRMVEARAVMEENRQLRATLGLSETIREPVATGRVVGSSHESPRRFAILSVGRTRGVAVGMPVRAAEGLVGRVIDAGALASRVLLVSDRASVVPARILRSSEAVIATGRGDGSIDLRPLEVGRNPFKKGDLVVTSGTGGLYPPLVPLAKVVRLDDDGAIALPIADPAEVGFAIVEQPFEPAALAAASQPAPGEAD